MKKLMTLMLGLSFLMGTVSLFAAQDKPADTTAKKEEEEDQESETRRRHRQEVASRLFIVSQSFCVAHAVPGSGFAMRDNFFGVRLVR